MIADDPARRACCAKRSPRPTATSSPARPARRCAAGIEAVLADVRLRPRALLDFSDVGLLDLSCADEVVAKLLLDPARRDPGRRAARRSARTSSRRSSTCSSTTRSPSRCCADRRPTAPAGLGHRPTARDRVHSARAATTGPGDARRSPSARLDRRAGAPTRARTPALALRLIRAAAAAPFVPLPPRMTTRARAAPPLAIHGVPHRRRRLDARWSPRSARAAPSSTRSARPTRCCTPATATTRTRWTSAKKYALLEGAEAALFVVSGMARHGAGPPGGAPARRPPRSPVAWIYGGTRRLFDEEFGRFGIDGDLRGPDAAARLAASRCGRTPAPSSSRRRPTR